MFSSDSLKRILRSNPVCGGWHVAIFVLQTVAKQLTGRRRAHRTDDAVSSVMSALVCHCFSDLKCLLTLIFQTFKAACRALPRTRTVKSALYVSLLSYGEKKYRAEKQFFWLIQNSMVNSFVQGAGRCGCSNGFDVLCCSTTTTRSCKSQN